MSISKYFYYFSFFMAFPGILFFGVNFSLIYFIFIYFDFLNKNLFFRSRNLIQSTIIFFAFGAIISTLLAEGVDGFSNSISVLFNYLYWCIIVIFISNVSNGIDFYKMGKFLLFGFLTTVLLNYFRLTIPLFLAPPSPNTFSFICICFAAPSSLYMKKKFGLVSALIFVSVIFVILISMERRAGTVLVVASCLLSLFLISVKPGRLLASLSLFILLFAVLQLSIIESLVQSSSPRIYELLYANDDLMTEDRSFLTRKLMVEKALLIFQEHPVAGIGLNNFSKYNVNFSGDFEGADFVINKRNLNEKSAHNSYAALLAEGGLLMFIPFIIIIFFNLYGFYKGFGKRSQMENSFYWSFLFVSVHLYFITAIVNVYTWFLFGIVTALSIRSIEKHKVHI